MSSKKLVIVESPTKAKTLSGILGKEYVVAASNGHVRDLPKKNISVDVENDFAPVYEVPQKAKKNVTALKKELKEADTVILATDPDREGEAIAWHLHELLTSKKGKNPKFERVVFHEITKEAIEDAFSHSTNLNMALVDAQQGRRVLDRLVGYNLSPMLWKKVRYGLSAGRVQSVAVRLIVEKERERDAFNSEEYWSIHGNFKVSAKEEINAELFKYKDKKIEIGSEKEALKIETELKDDSFKVSEVKKSERKRKPYAPYKTSTLQQSAANVYGFSAKKTMSAAQKLFEKGLITYHRTDSITLSKEFTKQSRAFVDQNFGKQYLPEKPTIYKSKSKNAQEAHEAIRPTNLSVNPDSPKYKKLGVNEQKIYSLIFKRSLESQMLSAVFDRTTIEILSDKAYLFRASGSVIKFDGWLAVAKKYKMDSGSDDINELPEVAQGSSLDLKELKLDQHFTQPPARYSDATLIKALEEEGIGRPSTYAPTISTIINRGYVKKDGRYFVPDDVAYVVTDMLVEHFPTVSDYKFTAEMEEDFDQIANGTKNWVDVIREFYEPFIKNLEKKEKELHKADMTKLGESDEKCPECGKILYIKLGKYGKFLSCSGFPDCKYAKPLEEIKALDENGEEITDFGKCDKCEDGEMILKQGRYGKFLACSNYPKCKNTKNYLDKIGMKCPTCETGDVVVKSAKNGRTFYGCSNYPACEYASWKDPRGEKDSEDSAKDSKVEKEKVSEIAG